MFRLEDKENFLILRSFAASIAALLCGGDGSLLTHERPVSKLTRLQHRPLASCKAGALKGRAHCTGCRRAHMCRERALNCAGTYCFSDVRCCKANAFAVYPIEVALKIFFHFFFLLFTFRQLKQGETRRNWRALEGIGEWELAGK